MKIKKVKIGIRTLEDGLKHFAKVAKIIEKGKTVKNERGVYFENLATMRKILTDRRIEVLKLIKDKKPSSVYELAKALHRDLKNVNEDLRLLEQSGLVSLKKSKTDRQRITPTVNYDTIQLEISV
ncbi:MAG: MarR family transcriptional regulator [Candidatus Schekmanbacteria bacterium]|nr:MarR family transcriptional regulator [Candidatus Schekmanbacteria bacterium]